jgi:hypothetical protein
MVEDFILDMEESFGPMWTKTWRCMNCGFMHDSVLQKNRHSQVQGVQPIASSDSHATDDHVPLGIEAITRAAA